MISTFWLVLGYACNNRCWHCYAAPSGFSRKWMDTVFAKEVMSTMKTGDAKTCLLIGGEPTLYPHLIEIVSFGSKIELKMVIVSNGRRLKNKDFAIRLFQNGLDRAVISLEGANTETHNAATGRRSFNETVQAFRTVPKLDKSTL